MSEDFHARLAKLTRETRSIEERNVVARQRSIEGLNRMQARLLRLWQQRPELKELEPPEVLDGMVRGSRDFFAPEDDQLYNTFSLRSEEMHRNAPHLKLLHDRVTHNAFTGHWFSYSLTGRFEPLSEEQIFELLQERLAKWIIDIYPGIMPKRVAEGAEAARREEAWRKEQERYRFESMLWIAGGIAFLVLLLWVGGLGR